MTEAIRSGAIALAKVPTPAVAESYRRNGIGAALLSRVKKGYFTNGYPHIYGQIPPGRPGLVDFLPTPGFRPESNNERL